MHLAQALVDRLEKISADSIWAHRASGIRAALVKILARENPASGAEPAGARLREYLAVGFEILENAAGQIPGDDET